MSRFACLCVLSVCGVLRAQSAPPVNVTVDGSRRFQTIVGFGTSLSDGTPVSAPSFQQMYTQDLGASLLREVLTPVVVPNQVTFGTDLQSNIGLLNFHGISSQNNWGQFAQYASTHAVDQMKVIGSIWTPPAWMKTNNSQSGGSLIQTPDNLQQFARYMAAYVAGFQQAYGVPLYAVSLQNELRFAEPYPSCVYSPSQYVATLNAVGAEFARDGIKTVILGPEDVGVDGGWITSQQMSFINAVNADATAKNYLGIYAVHGYWGNFTQTGTAPANWADYAAQINAIGDGKPSWMTEESNENPAWVHFDSNGNPDGALAVALNIHNGLTYGNFNAWVNWQTDDGYGSVNNQTLESNGDPYSFKFNAAKHYYKFIRPGSVRVDATPDNLTGINVDAYVNDANHTLTIELINASGAHTPTNISIPLTNYTSFAEYLTDSTRPWAALPDVTVSNGMLSLTIPAYSVVTLESDGIAISLPEPGAGLMSVAVLLLGMGRRRAL